MVFLEDSSDEDTEDESDYGVFLKFLNISMINTFTSILTWKNIFSETNFLQYTSIDLFYQ